LGNYWVPSWWNCHATTIWKICEWYNWLVGF
jgi:hypothetical protein